MTGFFLRSLRLLAKAESAGAAPEPPRSSARAVAVYGGGGRGDSSRSLLLASASASASALASPSRRRRGGSSRRPPTPRLSRVSSIASAVGATDAGDTSGSCRISLCSSRASDDGLCVDGVSVGGGVSASRRSSMASSCGGSGVSPSIASSGSSSSSTDHAVADALRAWDAAAYQPALVAQLRSAADSLGRGRAVLRRRSRERAASPPATTAAAVAAVEDGVLTESTKALAASVRSLVVALEAERLVRERAEVTARLLAATAGAGVVASSAPSKAECGWAVGEQGGGGELVLPTSPV